MNIMKKQTHQFLLRAFLLEGLLLGIAMLWAYWRNIPLQRALEPTLFACLFGVMAGVFVLVVNYWLIEYGSRYVACLRTIRQLLEQDISPLFRHLDVVGIAFIAMISGIAEEFFFRGVLQAEIGIWLTSLLFGLGHIWSKTAVLYGIYASLIGGFFGAIYLWSGNLWVPMLAHIVNNFVAILYYRHYFTPSQSHALAEHP